MLHTSKLTKGFDAFNKLDKNLQKSTKGLEQVKIAAGGTGAASVKLARQQRQLPSAHSIRYETEADREAKNPEKITKH